MSATARRSDSIDEHAIDDCHQHLAGLEEYEEFLRKMKRIRWAPQLTLVRGGSQTWADELRRVRNFISTQTRIIEELEAEQDDLKEGP